MTLRKTLQHVREFFKLQPEQHADELYYLKSSYTRVTIINIGSAHIIVFHNSDVIVKRTSSHLKLFKQLSGEDVIYFQGYGHDNLADIDKLLLTLVTSSLPDPIYRKGE